jgi:large subunit ribosomal protein L12
MEYIYSALVLHAAGKPVDQEGITNVLKSAGLEVDESRVKALVGALEGVDISEAIATAAVAPAAAGGAPAEAPAEEEEEEKEKKHPSEEEAMGGLGSLFG